MSIWSKFLKNSIDKKLILSSLGMSFLLLLSIVYCAFFTNIGLKSEFDMSMVNIKVIDMSYVFLSNSKLIFLNIILGIFTVGLYPLFSIIQNIYSLSVISNTLVLNDRAVLVNRLLPHGIIEIFVLVASLLLVISIWIRFFKIAKMTFQKSNKVKKYGIDFLKWASINLIFIEILLAIAAVIEYFVSIYL